MAHLKNVKPGNDLIEKIRLLLIEANSFRYTAGPEMWEALPDGGLRFFYPEKYGLAFCDQYWGANPYWGYKKIVSVLSGAPIWMMSYYSKFFKGYPGHTVLLTNKARIRGINEFLHQVLSDPDLSFPIVGKSGKTSGALVYFNGMVGNSSLAGFTGKELITHGGEGRYECQYLGGLICK